MSTSKWQRAKMIPGALGEGRILWVRIGPPQVTNPRNWVNPDGTMRRVFDAHVEKKTYETNLVREFGSPPLYVDARTVELEPEFAEHVERRTFKDWMSNSPRME